MSIPSDEVAMAPTTTTTELPNEHSSEYKEERGSYSSDSDSSSQEDGSSGEQECSPTAVCDLQQASEEQLPREGKFIFVTPPAVGVELPSKRLFYN